MPSQVVSPMRDDAAPQQAATAPESGQVVQGESQGGAPKVPFKEKVIGVAQKARGTVLRKISREMSKVVTLTSPLQFVCNWIANHGSLASFWRVSLPDAKDPVAEKSVNPVLESARFAYKATGLVQINDNGVQLAAKHIRKRLSAESYTPRTWRTQPLHILPPEPYDVADSRNKFVLDWIFLISSLNFSFWSEKEGQKGRYGVEWRDAWELGGGEGARRTVWTGYWSLVAALDRALADDGIPVTDPHFYSSETRCPDSVIEHVFRPAPQCTEEMPLLKERIAIMRQVGRILCTDFGGSYLGFIEAFHKRHDGKGTALDLVKMVTETFPSFRDETHLNGRKGQTEHRQDHFFHRIETFSFFFPLP
ncbi:hypothetical protein AX17_005301 [Amanita inopinata Kibby_2008]|nr:hypothetical protein AX17_005301 [Amanita inopinata Kibby_2008]